jgi:8-oxo-dGTP diphosphatase
MRPTYVVNVEVAIVRDGRYLLIVRGAGEAHAPGTLSLPGGKVEGVGQIADVLEETARREAAEEVGLALTGPLAYVRSTTFVTDDGDPVVNIVFLASGAVGGAVAHEPDEVAGIVWLTPAEVAADPQTPSWTALSVARAEEVRRTLGW